MTFHTRYAPLISSLEKPSRNSTAHSLSEWIFYWYHLCPLTYEVARDVQHVCFQEELMPSFFEFSFLSFQDNKWNNTGLSLKTGTQNSITIVCGYICEK